MASTSGGTAWSSAVPARGLASAPAYPAAWRKTIRAQSPPECGSLAGLPAPRRGKDVRRVISTHCHAASWCFSYLAGAVGHAAPRRLVVAVYWRPQLFRANRINDWPIGKFRPDPIQRDSHSSGAYNARLSHPFTGPTPLCGFDRSSGSQIRNLANATGASSALAYVQRKI